ncbi:MAG TPA: winged helix-turn-helix domain-containing protein [Candidatus Sulfotelmatobacter sp.]|nr:winged helix-turn-helix domain-containing protein [Candidatus Sulfotelmatobacter sp.]
MSCLLENGNGIGVESKWKLNARRCKALQYPRMEVAAADVASRNTDREFPVRFFGYLELESAVSPSEGFLPLSNHSVHFGPFQLDLSTAELHNNGVTTKLASQPFQILAELLQHPGEVVTREELRQRLWHSDTFVDFENGLNKAVKRLREALGDSAENPIYIETLPRRGYRLMVPVECELPLTLAAAKPPLVRRKIWLVCAVVGVVIAILAFGGVWRQRSRHVYALKSSDAIVLANFDNKTGDPVFDDTLKQGLSIQLEQSPFLALVSERKVNETLKLMGRPASDRLTPEIAREVCQRMGGKATLTGSIAGLGSQYVIGLKAVICETGDVLAEAQEQAAGKEAVLKALDAAAVRLRSKLGESLSSVQKYATPLEEASTPSLEALRAYSLGVKTVYLKGDTASLSFFKRATELDPSFAMAYERLTVVHFNLDEIGLAAEYGRKAYALREKVSERERFYIESNYYSFVTGELEKAAKDLELWQQTYPQDEMTYLSLGFIFSSLGDWEKALQEWQEAVRLEPNYAEEYYLLGVAYMGLNRLDEAEAVYKQAEERKLESEALLQGRYWLAFLKGDAAGMAQLASTAMGKPGAEDLLLAMQADTEGWYGKLKNARELTRRAMDSAKRDKTKEAAGGYQAEAALREVEAGNREEARAEARAALKLVPNRDVRAISALALARAGDTAWAEKLATELDKAFPVDTLVQRYWLPSIRAAVALERKDPNRSIELLQSASTIELSSTTADLTILLCPVYLRGEAYLMLHDGKRAAAEFQKFIDHRGVVINFPWGALARLGLARAYAMEGDPAKAKVAYQDFLALWKNADSDIPILKQAKVEYAKLQ